MFRGPTPKYQTFVTTFGLRARNAYLRVTEKLKNVRRNQREKLVENLLRNNEKGRQLILEQLESIYTESQGEYDRVNEQKKKSLEELDVAIEAEEEMKSAFETAQEKRISLVSKVEELGEKDEKLQYKLSLKEKVECIKLILAKMKELGMFGLIHKDIHAIGKDELGFESGADIEALMGTPEIYCDILQAVKASGLEWHDHLRKNDISIHPMEGDGKAAIEFNKQLLAQIFDLELDVPLEEQAKRAAAELGSDGEDEEKYEPTPKKKKPSSPF